MIETICPKEYCTACNACKVVCPKHCISMEKDELDVLYPVIDYSSCIECGSCIKTCPNNNSVKFHNVQNIFASWSNNTEIRKNSASGGVAAEIYTYYLNNVNNSSVYGVKLDKNFEAVFYEIKSIDDIQEAQNSKYTYSNTENVFNDIKRKLVHGMNVLFVGLPCQVAGLLSFLKKDFTNLTTIDLVCHGVAPTEYLKQHVLSIEKQLEERATSLSFRDPELVTSFYHFTLRSNGRLFYDKKVEEDDVYQIGYHKALIYRENCYNCKYARRERVSDLTLCDFASIGAYKSINYSRQKVSCILVNTDKGTQLLKMLNHNLFLEERPMNECFDFEPQLNHPYGRHLHRQSFVNDYLKTRDFEYSAQNALKSEILKYQKSNRLDQRIIHVITRLVNLTQRIVKRILRERI